MRQCNVFHNTLNLSHLLSFNIRLFFIVWDGHVGRSPTGGYSCLERPQCCETRRRRLAACFWGLSPARRPAGLRLIKRILAWFLTEDWSSDDVLAWFLEGYARQV